MADLKQYNVFLGDRLQESTFMPSLATEEELNRIINGYGYSARTRMMAYDALRSRVPGGWTSNNPGHDVLGPKEHGAWVEMMIDDNLGWAPVMMGLVPGYDAAKTVANEVDFEPLQGRSRPSIDSVAEGYKGLGRGLMNRINSLMDSVVNEDNITVPEQQILERRGRNPIHTLSGTEDKK